MKIDEINTELELRIAYLCAHHDDFLFEVASEFRPGLLENMAIERVVLLAIKYYEKFHAAPREKLQEWVNNASGLNQIPETLLPDINLVIQSFRTQKEPEDLEYDINESFRYFTRQSINLVTEEAKALSDAGRLDDAVKMLTEAMPIRRKRLTGGDILQADDTDIDDLFNDSEERLITLDGHLGKIMNNTLVRHGFVSFFGRNKVGKSHFLIHLARKARNQGRRVIFISTGDMTCRQCERRILQGDGRTTTVPEYVKNQRMPFLDCKKNQNGTCFKREGSGSCLDEFNELDPVIRDKDYQVCTACNDCELTVSYRKIQREALTAEKARELRDAWRQTGNPGVLHVEAFSSGNLTCSGLNSAISKICKKYKWNHPDVVVIDYADIMANEAQDERASVNKRWKFLRAVADEFKCLVVTATQANSSSFDFEDLTLRAFSEDRRKLDHVTGFFAINQRPEERREDVWRIAALNKREHPFDEIDHAKCYGCLALGSPHMVSHHVVSLPPKPVK